MYESLTPRSVIYVLAEVLRRRGGGRVHQQLVGVGEGGVVVYSSKQMQGMYPTSWVPPTFVLQFFLRSVQSQLATKQLTFYKASIQRKFIKCPINELYDKLLPKDLEFEFYISL